VNRKIRRIKTKKKMKRKRRRSRRNNNNRVRVIIKRKTNRLMIIAFCSQSIYTVNYSTEEKRKSQRARNRKYTMV